jgi:fucose permease
MISAYYGAMLVLALPAGRLVDRSGLRAGAALFQASTAAVRRQP